MHSLLLQVLTRNLWVSQAVRNLSHSFSSIMIYPITKHGQIHQSENLAISIIGYFIALNLPRPSIPLIQNYLLLKRIAIQNDYFIKKCVISVIWMRTRNKENRNF